MKILILDGKRNSSLAAARNLASKDFFVTCADDGFLSKSLFSRACNRRFTYTSPRISIRQFLKDVENEIEQIKYDAILPMTESTIWPISTARDRFKNNTLVLLPPHHILKKALDKEETIRIAKELALPFPETWTLRKGEDLTSLAKRVSYPAVIKPKQSEVIIGDRVMEGGRPVYANSEVEFLSAYKTFDRNHLSPIVQEFVPGKGLGIFTCFHLGKPLVWFAHRRLRDVHPTGSGSSLRQSCLPREDLIRYADALLNAFKWQGVAMVEFREDVRSGIPKIMEVNGRFWNSLPLSIAAGIDFPCLLVKSFTEQDVETVTDFKQNVHCRWLLGDMVHLKKVISGRPKGFVGDFPKKKKTIISFLRDFFDPNMHYDVWSAKDPLPFLIEVLESASRAFIKKRVC